tara:strand:+ start:114 stop:803 length:690 start_codon:yes stop_codon:yes gene_type:complete
VKTAIMQPYFLPYIGYWQLINLVDQFVIYDDVDFIKGGYINRNSLLVNKSNFLFTLSLKKSSTNKKINEIFLGDINFKILKTIKQSYKKAPFFNDVFPLIEDIFCYEEKNLALFISYSLKKISKYLNIDTDFIFSSSLNYNKESSAENKVINICKILNSNNYVNSYGGLFLYNKDNFIKQNIVLSFLKTNKYSYRQFKNPFVSNLSIIDIIMFNDIIDTTKLLNNYKLL